MGGMVFLAQLLANSEIEQIYIVPLSHTDIGFTAAPSEVARQYVASGKKALDAAKSDPDYVWNFETFWQLEQWLEGRGDSAKLVELVRKGRIGISAAYVNPHTSLMSAWTLDGLFRLPVAWGKKQGLQLDWAMINDVPGHPADLPHFLAANGVRYLALGVNQSLSKPLPIEVCDTPFWWEAPDGSRVLTWISADSYTEAYMLYGVDPGTARFFNPKVFKDADPMAVMRQGISGMMARFEKSGYPYDSVLAFHGFDNWGSDPSRRLPEAMRLWNKRAEAPRIVLGTPGDFLRHIEARYGKDLPVRRGGFGGQWEVVRTGTPTAMARARAEEERIMVRSGRTDLPGPDAAAIGRLLVYWEHSFGMGPPWPDLLTREQWIAHNRDQRDLVAGWALPHVEWPKGKPLEIDQPAKDGDLRTNGLYYAKAGFGPLAGEIRGALPERAWPSHTAETLANGHVLVRHSINRRQLEPEARIVWTWRLRDEDAQAPVVVDTATGDTRPDQDGLAGYRLDYWIAATRFQIGDTAFRPHGPFVFGKKKEYPGWLFAKALDQELHAKFKGECAAVASFDEAYPGEEELYEFAIEIESTPATSPPR